MRAPTRIVSVVALVALALMVTAPAAGAQAEDEPDNIVVLTGRAEVRSGETVDNVFIADGPVVVDGTVRDASSPSTATSSSAGPPVRTWSRSTAVW